MKHIIYYILIIVFLMLMLASISFAQPMLPGDPTQSPIDGGLGILAAAGGAYAIKKLRDRNK